MFPPRKQKNQKRRTEQTRKNTDRQLGLRCRPCQNIRAAEKNTANTAAEAHRSDAVVFCEHTRNVRCQKTDNTDQTRQADDAGHGERGDQQDRQPQRVYDYFCRALDKALSDTANALDEETEQENLSRMALELALRSYADRLACQRILSLLQEKEAPADEKKQGKAKEKTKEKRE